jgi:hypothetical protein
LNANRSFEDEAGAYSSLTAITLAGIRELSDKDDDATTTDDDDDAEEEDADAENEEEEDASDRDDAIFFILNLSLFISRPVPFLFFPFSPRSRWRCLGDLGLWLLLNEKEELGDEEEELARGGVGRLCIVVSTGLSESTHSNLSTSATRLLQCSCCHFKFGMI